MNQHQQKTPGKTQVLRLVTFATLLLVASWSFANPAASQGDANHPSFVIKATLSKITAFNSNADRVSPMRLRGFIENEIIPQFDFNNMSHWITGRYARHMSAEDKADFQRNLRETFLSSLSKHLGSFDARNTRVKFHRVRYRGQDEAFVGTSIFRPDALPVRLDFRMRHDGNNWRIIDIQANGSSAVLFYRRHFMSQLRQFQRQQRRFH